MKIEGNNIFRYFTEEFRTYYHLYENNNTYEYNKYMCYWEHMDTKKFYRWLTDKDKFNMNQLKEYYYNTLDGEELPF